MGIVQRTPLTKFDDIPGKLTSGTNPEDLDLDDVSRQAIEKLNNLRPDDLTETATWRDLLSFTGTYRTFYSNATVLDTLRKLSKDKQRSEFTLRDSKPRVEGSLKDISWVDVEIAFSLEANGLTERCEGIVSLIYGSDGHWRIWMLRTWLECFEGHGHPDVLEPALQSNGVSNGTTNGSVVDDIYDVIIVGGGQAGLSLAGRMKALGLHYVLLEKRPQVGDAWAMRYDSLHLHTSKYHGSLPFGHAYTEEDEYMLPIKRIGAAHKAWSERYGINVRTGTSVDSARWYAQSKTWTVDMTAENGNDTLKARNLVLSIGPGHLTPVSPDWAAPDKVVSSGFKGKILHGLDYKNCKAFAGQRGVVIGTANTAHDVAEDMANAGMETTMIQRSPTFVFPAEWLHHAEDKDYHPGKLPAVADRESFAFPTKITRELINRVVFFLIKNSPERFDALESAGFKVDRFGDIYDNLFVRFGGHYVDIGGSARIAKGEIKVKAAAVKGLTETGLLFEDGTEFQADLIVLCTGFDHDFRKDAARLLGDDVANQMDNYWGTDAEGELRGYAKFAGHPNLYYAGGDVRNARFFSGFIALQIQADVLGKPLQRYVD